MISKAESERLMAKVQAEQLLKQDQLMAEIDVSRASNDELRMTNEKLCRSLQQIGEHSAGERSPTTQLRAHPDHFRKRSWTLSYQPIS